MLNHRSIFVFCLFVISIVGEANSQSEWRFRKEKGGVEAYTRSKEGYSIDEYKVNAEIKGKISDIISIMTAEDSYLNIFNDLSELKFYEQRDDYFELYLVNEAPFPARDRDGYFISEFSYDHTSKTARIDITCPSTDFHQKKYIEITRCEGHWKFIQKEENLVHVEHQFIADPGGFVPGFILNIFLINNPISTIHRLDELLQAGTFESKEFEFLKN